MELPIELRDVAPRLATGAFILNSGLTKRGADEETAASLHGMAKGTYPFLDRLRPADFIKLLSTGEIALGTALLLPVVPTAIAGAGLATFSAGLLGLYARTPGMRRPNSPRPSDAGIALAKDVWLFGIGLGFFVDGLTRRRGYQSARK